MQFEEKSPPICQAPLDESSDSTRISTKRRRDRRSQLLDAMRALLGPQTPGMEGRPRIVIAQEVYPSSLAVAVMPDWLPHPPTQ